MLDWLTPSERRGAVLLVALLLIGAGWDLWQAGRETPRPEAGSAPSAAPPRKRRAGDAIRTLDACGSCRFDFSPTTSIPITRSRFEASVSAARASAFPGRRTPGRAFHRTFRAPLGRGVRAMGTAWSKTSDKC